MLKCNGEPHCFWKMMEVYSTEEHALYCMHHALMSHKESELRRVDVSKSGFHYNIR